MLKNSYYLKVAWKKDELAAVIRIFDPISNRILDTPVPRFWNIATGNIRHCTGYKDLAGIFVPCPDGTAIEPGISSSTCSACFSRDPWRYRATSRGEAIRTSLNSARSVKEDEETSVYLTLVGEKLKVGVSTEPIRRWLDQGSDYSILVWHGDGLTARRIENRIEAIFDNIAKTVTFSQKIKALREITREQEARKKLLSYRKKVHDQLELPPSMDFDSSFFNLLKYQGPLVKTLKTFTPFLQEIKEQTLIKGELVTIKGSLLVLKEKQSFYAYNLHQLKGWEVQDPVEVTEKQPRQRSLMDFV